MSKNHQRKKQPELVRELLLEAARDVAQESGLAAITLERVARLAGVSKGGLLHHFPNRRALLEGLARQIISDFAASVAELVAADEEPRGRFTRAYVRATAGHSDAAGHSRVMGALALAMAADDAMADIWRNWLREQLRQQGESDASLVGQIVRLAADGIWLDDLTGSGLLDFSSRHAAVSRLLNMTYEI